jgi:hypothetical protein
VKQTMTGVDAYRSIGSLENSEFARKQEKESTIGQRKKIRESFFQLVFLVKRPLHLLNFYLLYIFGSIYTLLTFLL